MRGFVEKNRVPTVAFFVPSLEFGGAERQLVELAKAIDKCKWRVLIITFSKYDKRTEKLAEIGNIKTIYIPRTPLVFGFLMRLKRSLESEGVSILQSYLATAQSYALLVKLLGWKGLLVFGVRDSLPLFYHKTVKSIMCDLMVFNPFFLADRYIFNSYAGLVAKRHSIPAGRETVIFNSVDTDRFKPSPDSRKFLRCELGVGEDILVVGMVANISEYKDYPTFIRAAQLVQKQLDSAHFAVIGNFDSEPGEQARALVEDLALETCFHFFGARCDVERLMPGFDVLCSSSITEGFSNVICEAMASSVPCVVTNVGDSAQIVGDVGMVVPPRDPAKLASALLSMLCLEKGERMNLGIAARALMIEKFSPQKAASQHEAIYESLMVNLP